MTEKELQAAGARAAAPALALLAEMEHLRAINADLLAALEATQKLIRDCQDALTNYLTPDGCDADHAIEVLIGMLDGPEQREIQTRAFAALSKARGER